MKWGLPLRPRDASSVVCEPVTLNPVLAADYDEWLALVRADEEALRRVQPTWPDDHLGRDAFRRRLALYDAERVRGTGHAWHVHADGRMVGVCRLAGVKGGAAKSADLGYWIASRDAGRGYATAAVRGACDYAFERLGLMRITASYLPDNLASARVLEKAGFTAEGLARSYLEIDGVRRDHVLSARLSEDPA